MDVLRKLPKSFSNGLLFGVWAAFSVLLVSFSYAAWGSMTRATENAPISASAWNQIVDNIEHLNGLISTPSSSHGQQMFAANGTFAVPAGVTKVYVSIAWGGGGGGGWVSSESSQVIGAAWGGRGAARMKVEVSIPQGVTSVPVTVWSGGAGGAPGGNGAAGTASSFGTYLSAAWGGGWTRLGWSVGGAAWGPGWTDGEASKNDSYNGQIGGKGGATMFGAWGPGGANAAGVPGNGRPGGTYGWGGGWAGSSSNSSGWAGAPGFVLVEW